ncbi:MAG: amidase family protein, partial [Acidimicrobiia bacterium]|nr:amidase family protein [Acidimicrobiia bacterium]
MSDVLFESALVQAGMLRRGEISSRELVALHFARIEQVNPALNAIVTTTPELALEQAAAADAAHARGESVGVLHGLPIAHKDLVATKGIRTTMGSAIFADQVPASDALIVRRERAAGAVTIGKTNVPEFGAGSQTFNEVFGVTANPYDRTKTCGGSSGGAAVALATGMTALADGSDMGGSLRNPAAFCNVVGLRPSPGRVPSWPKDAAWTHLSTEGPMGRTVEDVALLLSAIAGPDPRSPIALERPGSDFSPPIQVDPAGLRVAWSPDLGGLPVDSTVLTALARVPDIFEGLRCVVAEDVPDLAGAREIFQVRRAWNYEASLGAVYDQRGDEMKDTVRWNIEEARRLSMVDHARAASRHAQLYQRVCAFFERYDALVCPVTQVPPFDINAPYITDIEGVPLDTYIDWMRSCT